MFVPVRKSAELVKLDEIFCGQCRWKRLPPLLLVRQKAVSRCWKWIWLSFVFKQRWKQQKHLSLLKQWRREGELRRKREEWKKGPHSASSRLGYIILPNKRLQPVILTHYIFDYKCRFHFLYLIRPRRRLRIFRLLFSAFLLSFVVIVCLLLCLLPLSSDSS